MDYKNEFQKFLVEYYKNDSIYTYLVFEMNGGIKKFLAVFSGKNRKILGRKCENIIEKIAMDNKKFNGFEYSSRVTEYEKCF